MNDPPVPADTDVRAFPGMVLDCERLIDSTLTVVTSGDEFKAAVLLWCKAWRQVPAGSLPNDDRQLARWSGYDERWDEIREGALHGFVPCSDGRLYHPVICEKALNVLAGWQERSRHGRVAATKRWEHKKKLNNARAMPEQSPSNAHLMPIDANSKKEPLLDRSEAKENDALTSIAKASRATRLRDDFQMPPDWIEAGRLARAKQRLPPADLATEAVMFANHWISKDGKDGAKRDWHRTWINWALRARGGRTNAGTEHGSASAAMGEWARNAQPEGLRGNHETADRSFRAESMGGESTPLFRGIERRS